MNGGPEEEPPRPLLSAGFWAMIVLGLICVVGGAGVWLLAQHRAPAAPTSLGEPHRSR